MSKKSFRGGLDAVLRGGPDREEEAGELADKAKRGRPKTNLREIEKSSQEGCKPTETRATFIVNEEELAKIKALAYWERLQIKDVISAALREYVERYEKQSGELKPVPKR
jgi:hypothetical protein